MSGSGKGTVLRAFEDLGFFCIDNLPVSLISKFIEGIHVSGGAVERAALVIDIRAGGELQDFEKTLAKLGDLEFRLFILFLEARDDVLLRRFSETRRPHPLSTDKPLKEAIQLERKRLAKIRNSADIIMDTSEYSIHEAKRIVMDRFRSHPRTEQLHIYLVSFGYKYGVPLEADLLFDARFLPNPYFVAPLRDLTGKDQQVIDYMRSFVETKEFVQRIQEFLEYLIPYYAREGKSYLTVGVGCTGGRHRSVFVVEELAKLLKSPQAAIEVRHRDKGR
jgi:UPF0042 nucleotide-binding protein